MIAPRRVTLRTSWIQEDGSGSQDGVKTGPGKGSLCPGCGVPLKRTGSGSMSCWFCEKEFDIDPSDLKEELKKGTGKEEPKWGRPASELEEDEEVFSPDGKKQEDIYDFEIEMNNGEEEEEKVEEWGGHQEMEEDIEFDEDEEGEEEEIEEEEWKIDSEEVTEEEEEEEIEEEEWKIDSEEVMEEEEEEEIEEEEWKIDNEEVMEEEEIEEEEDIFDPIKYKKRERPEELEEVEDDLEIEFDDE